jgi:hypothetical protein
VKTTIAISGHVARIQSSMYKGSQRIPNLSRRGSRHGGGRYKAVDDDPQHAGGRDEQQKDPAKFKGSKRIGSRSTVVPARSIEPLGLRVRTAIGMSIDIPALPETDHVASGGHCIAEGQQRNVILASRQLEFDLINGRPIGHEARPQNRLGVVLLEHSSRS